MEEKNNLIIEVYNVFKDYLDEQNPMTKDDIYRALAERGIGISDDTLTKCIKQINNQMDIKINVTKGRYAKYQLVSRLFKYSELKLMIDAINSSSVIDEKTTTSIVEKLKKTGSLHEAKELERSSTGVNKAKTQNTILLENVDMIQKAFKEHCRIEFDYMEWTPKKKLKIKKIKSSSGKEFNHSMEPWKLFWADDRYYLFGYDTYMKEGEQPKIRNYRVDKMCNIRLLEEKRQFIDQFSQFNLDAYVIGFKTWSVGLVKEAMELEDVSIDVFRVEDGIYEGHSELGPVIVDVKVTVKKGKITEIEIVNHQNGLGQPANAIVNEMLDKNTYEVDAVSGATVSSEIIINAVNDALLKGLR